MIFFYLFCFVFCVFNKTFIFNAFLVGYNFMCAIQPQHMLHVTYSSRWLVFYTHLCWWCNLFKIRQKILKRLQRLATFLLLFDCQKFRTIEARTKHDKQTQTINDHVYKENENKNKKKLFKTEQKRNHTKNWIKLKQNKLSKPAKGMMVEYIFVVNFLP